MTKKTDGTSRRDFLKLAGTTAPIATVALATGATQAEAQPVDLNSDSDAGHRAHPRIS